MVAAATVLQSSKQQRMALQLGYLVHICLNFVLEVGGGIVYTYNHVNDHGQPAVQWNKTSRDQEHEMTPCPPWKYHKYNNSSCMCRANVYNIVDYEDDYSIAHLQSCHCM